MAKLVNDDFSKYWSPDDSRNRALSTMIQADNELQGRMDFSPTLDPRFDYGLKAYKAGAETAEITQQSALNAAQNVTNQALQDLQSGVGLNTGGGNTPRLKAILSALRSQESGGNYGAVNKDSGALGAYQVMPSNLAGTGRGWDYEALGRDITSQQFLASKKLQNQITRYKFGSYLKKHGLQGALSSWYSGSPTRWNEKTPQGNYPSVRDYVLQVISRLK